MNKSNVINLPGLINEETKSTGLDNAIRASLSQFLNDLDGENPGNIYDLVIQQVEAPLLELILKHVDGNQSKAADYLGINRGTLRKKLKAYQLIR
ncbi:MAG TPA: Fis family transcriptional regulator [Gammaproteobacteria bacterium]|nr:Fis family transcriptional regulator [Gammaproteobacteria bacterium]